MDTFYRIECADNTADALTLAHADRYLDAHEQECELSHTVYRMQIAFSCLAEVGR
jgi:hypothetical protein